MKMKQVLGVVVTGLVIIVVGVTGVASNQLTQKQEQAESVPSFLESMMADTEVELPEESYIAKINIDGEIGPTEEESIWSTTTGYNHDLYMNYVDQLIEDSKNYGILLYINSPGGTVYESDELYLKLMEYKEKTKRPIWAYFGSEACSGGYYIAMAADKIYANRNCWTGSIGVIVSLVNCKELYDKVGIKEIDITSGENKSMGSSGLDLTKEQQEILQGLVDEAYDQFVGIVATGRNLEETQVRKLADGRIYSASQALELKLVDEIATLEETKTAFAKELSFSEDVLFHEPEQITSDLFTGLFSLFEGNKSKTELELATDIVENHGNGVLKYYAK